MSKTLRVLIADDSEVDALLIASELEAAGYELICKRINTAAEMKTALEELPWDLVISDHYMPGFNSKQALELLQSTGLDLPFIIVSGAMGDGTAVAMMKAGAHDCLQKGRLARLAPAVERELQNVAIRRERQQAEQALHVSQASLAAMQRIAQLGSWELDLSDLDDINKNALHWSD
ncbi:MAG TPA: response regulator, partial [Burkholderiales bacterium]|nr:response regulator [Burkholderiales bacterium]